MSLRTSAFDAKARKAFCDVLAVTDNVSMAAAAVGISTSTAYEHRKTDPVFAAMWAEAQALAADSLEYALRRRAMEGVREPLFYKGEPVLWPPGHPQAGKQAYKVTYPEASHMFLLRGAKPEKYRDRQDVTMAASVVHGEMDDETLALKVNEAMARMKLRKSGEAADGVRDVPFTMVEGPSFDDLA